jgi:hypothetical protein
MAVLAGLGALVLVQAGGLLLAARGLRIGNASYGQACAAALGHLLLVTAVLHLLARTGLPSGVAGIVFSLLAGAYLARTVFRTTWRRAVPAWGAAALCWLALAWLAAQAGHHISALL